jgi:hypothetical protein
LEFESCSSFEQNRPAAAAGSEPIFVVLFENARNRSKIRARIRCGAPPRTG